DDGAVEPIARVAQGGCQDVAEVAQDAGGGFGRGEGQRTKRELAIEAHVALDGGKGESKVAARQGEGGTAGDELVVGGVIADEGGEGHASLVVAAGAQGAAG